jgi:1-acyl-sn-glycerol-3-phosphate acyltransferase
VRLLSFVARFVFFGLLRFRIARGGLEHVPPRSAGGYLLVGAIHRGWFDPFLVLHALPLEPRAWFLGSAATAFNRRWKEWLLRGLGGMLPVWRGGVGVDQHLASARAVMDAGGVFVLFPEGGVAGPPGRLSAFRVGAALIALRTGAPVLLLAMAGSEELHVGRRLATRVLPLTSARELLGLASTDPLPEVGSREELDLARRLSDRFAQLLGPPVTELAASLEGRQPRRKIWRGLTWLLLSRRIDR